MNEIWILICACVVFFMQAGFTCYEAGFVQSKNVISVAIENMFNLTVTIVVFALVGFPLMFGQTIGGIIGSSYWLLSCPQEHYAFFFLQIMIAATSVTIFAGALSERTKIGPLIMAGGISAGIIYPIYGHWVWSGMLTEHPGWLEKLGFMDFAGASVVHMTAGFIALAGLIIVGPRKNPNTGKSNIPLAVLGVFILWFGWFGFNGSCVGSHISDIPKVLLNTTVAAACGTFGAFLINFIFKRNGGYLISLFNGVLGGLVAITAVSEYCTPHMAMVVGFTAGILADLSTALMQRIGLDDVVNVVPVHLVGGITGCLLLPFVVDATYLHTETRLEQLGVQFIGIFANFLWVFITSFIMFKILNRIWKLRVTPEEEKKGLNIVEFNDIYSWEKYQEISAYESEINDKNKLLRKQARLLVVTEEQEKNKLAKDLHDGVGQSLSALKLVLGMGFKQAEKAGDNKLMETTSKARQLADNSVKEMRYVLNNLKPEILQKEGLGAAIRAMVSGLDEIDQFSCQMIVEDELPAFDDTVELNIYRLIQEALNNVVKHAKASQAKVICRKGSRDNHYMFIVQDNGCGFNPTLENSGIGISSMKDRVSMLGGKFDLYSKEGSGTTVVMEVLINEGY